MATDTHLQRPMSGSCQCLQVHYRIDGEPLTYYACHCRNCQNQSGSAFGLSLWVNADEFVITSGSLQIFEVTADSGRINYCGFCDHCGTHIIHSGHHPHKSSSGGTFSVKPGTLDHSPDLEPVVHLWMRSAQPWVRSWIDQGNRSPHRFDTEPEDDAILIALWQQAHPRV